LEANGGARPAGTDREAGGISGNFTQKEIESLVNILRAGALPMSLRPQPISETTIEEEKKELRPETM
jgi:preprotein translocase subunit SecD